jgi:Male sterility protein
LYTLLLHILPALLIDFLIICIGKKPRFVVIISRFLTNNLLCQTPWTNVNIYISFPELIKSFSLFYYRLLKTYKKIHKFANVISFFCTNEWTFTNDNVQMLWSNLNSQDRELFFFDMSLLNWEEYISHYMLGMRIYLFKDDLSNVNEARKKWRR